MKQINQHRRLLADLKRLDEALARATVISARLHKQLSATTAYSDGPGLEVLPPRQRQVTEYLVAGQQKREIARTLGLSLHTVEVHQRLAMKTLGVRNMAQLVGRALCSVPLKRSH